MRDDKKVSSIAKRINAYWTRRTMLLMGLLDAVLGTMIAASWITVQAEVFWPCIAGAEVALALLQYRVGKEKAKRLMEPLERIALTAQELSQARFDPEKLHHLEDAIGTVVPLSPDAHVITGEKELQGLEQAINDLLNRTQESYREQTRFVSDASHELRTPIAVIQGMKKLIEQLLFLARGDNGRNQLVFEDFDLSQMMTEVFEESRMIHPDRDWRLDALEPVMVNGDAAMLKQTARILADNAVKYTGNGAVISLRTRFKEGSPCFEVQDNGIGIKQEDLEHIFDRFFRSDPARTRATGGTGRLLRRLFPGGHRHPHRRGAAQAGGMSAIKNLPHEEAGKVFCVLKDQS